MVLTSPLDLESILAAPLTFGRASGLVPLKGPLEFKTVASLSPPPCFQRADKSAPGPSVLSLPMTVHNIRDGVSFITMSPSLLPFLLCRSCSIRPQFFRRNCSINRYRFGVSVEKVSSGSSCVAILYLLTSYA